MVAILKNKYKQITDQIVEWERLALRYLFCLLLALGFYL